MCVCVLGRVGLGWVGVLEDCPAGLLTERSLGLVSRDWSFRGLSSP